MNTNAVHVREPSVTRLDRRVVRTRRALGSALIRLMHEKKLEEITIQEVLDAAGVGRSTFYGHFRGKQDLLLSHFEMVMEWLADRMEREPPTSRRLVPVAELLAHGAAAESSLTAIAASGQLDALYDLGQAHLRALTELRIRRLAPGLAQSSVRLALATRFCAAGLVDLAKWWLWRSDRPAPEEMDRLYHEMMWTGPLRAGGGFRLG